MALTAASRVVILGGTSGIGLAVAKAASAAGAVVIVASRNSDSVASALTELPDSASGRPVDASSSGEVEHFFAQTGEFDHLAYTAAGNLVSTTLSEYTPQKALDFLGLRLISAFDAVRFAVPHLSENGSITLTSGTAAFKGGEGWLLGATAGAIGSATRSLAAELAPIRVNAVAPGVTRSPLWSQMPGTDREEMYEAAGSSLPLGRVGDVDDIAKAYIQLMDQDYATEWSASSTAGPSSHENHWPAQADSAGAP
jgi:NAD(P)-dependent dehydrogenase (short-subunit alcohol dehydrogenase family)